MWTNRTNSKTAKSLSAQSSYGLASSLFSTGCTWSAEGALCEKSLTLTGKQSLHGAAVGYQTCVSASLIIPFNTHTLTRIHRVTPLADILRDFKTSQHNYLILLFTEKKVLSLPVLITHSWLINFTKKQINTIWQGRQSCTKNVKQFPELFFYNIHSLQMLRGSFHFLSTLFSSSKSFHHFFFNISECKRGQTVQYFIYFCYFLYANTGQTQTCALNSRTLFLFQP